MKILDRLTQSVEQLLASPSEELGRWARFLRFQVRLWRFCIRHLSQHNAMAMSAALSFRTIFTMVPVLVLALLVMKSFTDVERSREVFRQFLDRAGISEINVVYEEGGEETAAAQSEEAKNRQISAADKIEEMVRQVESKLTFGRIGPVGIALLVWTAITLLTTVERFLNRIYGAVRPRSVGKNIIIYWSLLTLGPMVLVFVGYLSRRANRVIEESWLLHWLIHVVGVIGPVIVGIVFLAVVYKLIPNTRVSFQSALIGAGIAVPSWFVAKWLFGLYVQLVGAKSLYGAMGILPIFLMYINLSWWIFLFGAEFSMTVVNLRRLELAERASGMVIRPSDLLAAALAAAGRYAAGGGPVALSRIADDLKLPEDIVQKLVLRLEENGVLCPVEGHSQPAYVPARPAERIGVLDVMELNSRTISVLQDRVSGALQQSLTMISNQAHSALGELTLADALKHSGHLDMKKG